jgi:3-hexulose-6-phosphate synthase/6-phospho-3-hexuloisomerase
MDAGYLEAEMMFRNGASFVVVMGQAHEHTIRELRAARDYDGYVMGDVMLCPDKVAMAKKMKPWASTSSSCTRASTSATRRGQVAARRFEGIRAAVKIPLQAVGGLSIDQRLVARARASLVVIARRLRSQITSSPGADADTLFETIKSFVDRVKGTGRNRDNGSQRRNGETKVGRLRINRTYNCAAGTHRCAQ